MKICLKLLIKIEINILMKKKMFQNMMIHIYLKMIIKFYNDLLMFLKNMN